MDTRKNVVNGAVKTLEIPGINADRILNDTLNMAALFK